MLTIQLSVASIVAGGVIGTALATLRSASGRVVRALVDGYVELIRNTPFLVQLFIIYFGLPGIGLRVGAVTASLIGMTINLAAYSTEIIRAGIEAVPGAQIEAGEALGFTQLQIYRYVIILPAIQCFHQAQTIVQDSNLVAVEQEADFAARRKRRQDHHSKQRTDR